MRVQVESGSRGTSLRARRLLRYVLTGAGRGITAARLRIDRVEDHDGAPLSRCRATLQLRDGRAVSVEEVQSSLDLAVRRAVDRGLRTSRRRLAGLPARPP